jgi:hypothetical protein
VGGLYQEGNARYPTSGEVREFVRIANARGSRGVNFWSYEHMSEEMWQAVTSAAIGVEEEEEMSSQEYQQVGAWVSALAGRVQRLEAQVGALLAAPSAPGAPPRRTYTVQPGDTLSGIAATLGLGGWQRLTTPTGASSGGPNRIYPGQGAGCLSLAEFALLVLRCLRMSGRVLSLTRIVTGTSRLQYDTQPTPNSSPFTHRPSPAYNLLTCTSPRPHPPDLDCDVAVMARPAGSRTARIRARGCGCGSSKSTDASAFLSRSD